MADAMNLTNQSNSVSNGDKISKFDLAKWIIIFSFTVIGLLGLAAIITGYFGNKDSFLYIKDILSILLPVISAWAGTVLAYYFSKENYESAARSTRALLTSEERLKSVLVKDVMIPIEKTVKLILDKSESDIKLKENIIDDILTKKDKNRLPILDSQLCPKYMIHRSMIDKFIVQEVANGKPIDKLTLKDFVDNVEFKNVITAGFNTIRETSNLSEVKAIIDRTPVCQDMFVTDDGTSKTKVIGWITNVIVLEQARI